MKSIAVVAAIGIFAGPASAQDQEDELTPARTVELLEDAKRQMENAEKGLNDGKAGRAESHEKGAAGKLAEAIKKARNSAGTPDRQRSQGQEQGQSKPRPPSDSAKGAHDPKRADEPSKFKSDATKSGSWGNLPLDVRRAMLSASKEDVPPEFQELWRTYYQKWQLLMQGARERESRK